MSNLLFTIDNLHGSGMVISKIKKRKIHIWVQSLSVSMTMFLRIVKVTTVMNSSKPQSLSKVNSNNEKWW